MSELYVRVDDRLIHGQIVTAWVKALNIERLIAVDDQIAQNPMMKMLVTVGVPSHLESLVVSKEQLLTVLATPSEKNTLVIFRFARELADVFSVLQTANNINIGNCSKQADAVFTLKGVGVGQMLSFTKLDVEALDKYNDNGVKVIIQQLPNDKAVLWENLKDRRS